MEESLDFLSRYVDGAEIYSSLTSIRGVEIKKGEIELSKESCTTGYGIRVLKDGRMGFLFSNSLDRETLERAVDSAKASERDAHVGLPERQNYASARGTYDRRIAEISTEEMLDSVARLLEPCSEQRVLPSSGMVSWGTFEVEIGNTEGVGGADRGTIVAAHLNTVAGDEAPSTGTCFEASRKLDLDFSAIGGYASELARGSLGAKKMGTRKLDVLLKPDAVTSLLENTLIPSFNAENVLRGRSVLGGKVGEQVFLEGLSMTDDALLEGALNTSTFDSEGVRSQRTDLVENGTLKGYLFDTYAANRMKAQSTGNAYRPTYTSPPQIEPTNFSLECDADAGEGALVVHGIIGGHTSNPVTGDFSVETRNSFLKGKPIKKAIISGNVFELLKRIRGFGKDYKQTSFVRAPSIEFEGVRVVG